MSLLAFARQSSGTQSYLEASGERLVNLYARPFPDAGIGRFIIAPSPGLTSWVTLGAGPVRAVMEQRGTIYAACVGRLWSVSAAGAVQDLGHIGDDPLTTIAGNGLDVAVASLGEYSVWDGSQLIRPDTGAFLPVGSVAAVGVYILLSELGGERFSVTSPNNAALIDALDFATAEASGDRLIRVHSDHAEAWLMGANTIEMWSNTGGQDFPFGRFAGGVVQRGIVWPQAVLSEDNGVWFVGDDRIVYRAAIGGQPQRVSTQALESLLTSYADDADIRAMSFTWDGSKVYALRLPDRPAWLFDIASGLWHERGTGLDEGPWLATCGVRLGAFEVLGGSDGRLHRLGGLTDAGDVIVREGVSLPLTEGYERFTLSEVRLVFRTGATDIGRDAQVVLQVSRDGREWGAEKVRSMGRAGNYDRPTRWHALGQARQFRVRFRITDPIDAALYGASYEAA